MDLTYNPGELDLKHLQKESSSSSGLKRDHDSVDDFEHLDPESSPVDILSKPLLDIDSKSDNITLKSNSSDKSDNIPKNQDLTFGNDVSNDKNTLSDIKLDYQNPNPNTGLEFDLKSTPIDSEIPADSVPKPVETVQFDHTLISDFISAEKAINFVKTDSESDLVGLGSNISKDSSGKGAEEAHFDSAKSAQDDKDLHVPAKSMKEAEAMSHYEMKLDKKDIGKKDSDSEEDKDIESFDKPESTKHPDNIETVVKNDPLEIHTTKDFVAVDPISIESKGKIIDKEDNALNRNHSDLKEDKYLENKGESKSSHKESEVPEPEPFVVKTQSDDDVVNKKNEVEEEYKDFPSTDDILKHRVCICPSKPESAAADLDDIIGPEDVFKRIGLDAWFTPGRLHPIVEALVYWRDPKKSGVVFGGVMTILLSICYMSLISVVGYFTLFVVSGAICFRIYKNILQAIQKTSSEGHPFKDYLEIDLSLPQDKVREMTDTAVVHINAALVELRRLVLVEDLIDSVKFALCMWCLTYVGAIFNGMTLVILAFVALFTVPKIYENNKASIDTYIEIGRSKVAEITSKVKAAVPIGKKEPEKDKEQ